MVGVPPFVYADLTADFSIVSVKAASVPDTRAVVPNEPAVPLVPPT